MSKPWNEFDDADREIAEQVFIALDVAAGLSASLAAGESDPKAEQSVGMADLLAYAEGPSAVMDPRLARALMQSDRLRRDLDRVLRRGAVAELPRVAAASTGTVDTREADGYRIRLVPARSADGQTYVIIEMPEWLEEPPATLFLTQPDGSTIKQPLPEPDGGRIQMLVESTAPLVVGLADIEAEVILR
jgi:hypothetical protein